MIKRVYLDYAAATPLDKTVQAAMRPYLAEEFYNPSSLYTPARQVRQAIEAARHTVAKSLGVKSGEVIFTAGATESINLSIRGLAAMYPRSNIVIGASEHQAVAAAAKAAFGTGVRVCPVKADGLIDLNELQKLIDGQTLLVSIQYANNEIGTIQPIAKIANLITDARRQRRNKLPLYLHTDASQAANYLNLKVSRLGVDLMTLNGGKIYGPKQTGCLYVRGGIRLEPLVYGGGQERGLRSGTENVAGFVGFSKALERATSLRLKESARLEALRDQLVLGILSIGDTKLNGSSRQRLPNNLNFSIKGVEGEMLVHYLDHAGIMAATGAACSASSDTASATLLAIGLNIAQANSSLRLTLGRQTTKADIEYTLKILKKLIDRLRA